MLYDAPEWGMRMARKEKKSIDVGEMTADTMVAD